MTDVIEAEVREIEEPRALVPAEPATHVILGGAGLALMSDADFEKNIAALAVARVRAQRIQLALMKEGTDYGKVPGIDRPFLHKPGAETLDKAFGLAVRFEATRVIGDSESEPPIAFHVKGFAHLGDFAGPVVAQGYGEANAWEERYRYRNADRICPSCQQPAIIKGKAEYGGGWVCFKRKGGCGAKWPDGAPEIEGQTTGKQDNPDPWGLANTLLKMAVKRAHVDTTLRATGTSGLFTQDEDSPVVASQPAQDGPGAAHAPAVDPMAPILVGPAEYTGRLTIGNTPSRDGQLRESPDDGAFIGFTLMLPDRKKISECVALDALAVAIATATDGSLGQYHGKDVTVSGVLWKVPWETGKPPYTRLVLDRLSTADFTLPAPAAESADDFDAGWLPTPEPAGAVA